MKYFNFAKFLLGHTKDNTFDGNPNCRMAAYHAQLGHCYVTGLPLAKNRRELHHRKPRFYGGEDTPENTILLAKNVHQLIHAGNRWEIEALLAEINPTPIQLRLINQLRFEAHMSDLPAINPQTVRPAA